jgi:SAM-dependent methyltransferase
MNVTPCVLCDGVRFRIYLDRVYALGDQEFDLIRCEKCGLIRVEPMPGLDDIRRMYNKQYFEKDFSCGVRKGTYLETNRVKEYRETLEALKEHKPSGTLLEVGCAAGSFLNYARRLGYQVKGVDISEWAAKTGREQFGLEIYIGRVVEVGLPSSSFDLIFLGDILEHEPKPVEFLSELKRLLKPDGVLAMKVPTYVNSFYYRTARLLPIPWTKGRLDRKLLQAMKLSREGTLLPPYHVYEYSLNTVRFMCEKVRLRVISHKNSLLIPEFLGREESGWPNRVARIWFRTLSTLVRTFNLPAGHVLVFSVPENHL